MPVLIESACWVDEGCGWFRGPSAFIRQHYPDPDNDIDPFHNTLPFYCGWNVGKPVLFWFQTFAEAVDAVGKQT